uniref:Uncharacterized protein n=1 Tax=Oryza glaberrima TaxID=4538 RepID=I1PCF0_ORYGL
MKRSNPTEVCRPTRSEPSSSTIRSGEIDQASRRCHCGEQRFNVVDRKASARIDYLRIRIGSELADVNRNQSTKPRENHHLSSTDIGTLEESESDVTLIFT